MIQRIVSKEATDTYRNNYDNIFGKEHKASSYCKRFGPSPSVSRGPGVSTYEWCKGWNEHIDVNPIYVESKEHYIRECKKRDIVPVPFMKRNSQGKGITFRR